MNEKHKKLSGKYSECISKAKMSVWQDDYVDFLSIFWKRFHFSRKASISFWQFSDGSFQVEVIAGTSLDLGLSPYVIHIDLTPYLRAASIYMQILYKPFAKPVSTQCSLVILLNIFLLILIKKYILGWNCLKNSDAMNP